MSSEISNALAPGAEPVAGSLPPADAPRRQPWLLRALLVLPFVLAQVLVLATGRPFPTFWGGDELQFHWPLILDFAHRLPAFDWQYKGSASTPLFHLLGGIAVRLFGPHIQLIRALNMLGSVAGVLALFETLRGPLRQAPRTAALYCAVVLSSCYFFGYAFRLLTDNLALVFCILAMRELFLFVDPAVMRPFRAFLLGCLWVGAAILTRQSYIFLEAPFFIALWCSPLSIRQKGVGIGALALAVAPFAAFVLLWHGMVPPAWQHKHSVALLTPRAALLVLMLLAIYGAVFDGPALLLRIATRTLRGRSLLLPAVAALAGIAVVGLFPMVKAPVPNERPDLYFAGLIYHLAQAFPKIRGNSLLFWLLVPSAFVAATYYLRPIFAAGVSMRRRLPAWFLLALLLSSLLNPVACQKYYDGLALLFLAWHARDELEAARLRLASCAALIFLFAAYHVRQWVVPTDELQPSPYPAQTVDKPA